MTRLHASPQGHWNWRIPVTHRHGTRHDRLMIVGGQADLARGADGAARHHEDIPSRAQATIDNIGRVLSRRWK